MPKDTSPEAQAAGHRLYRYVYDRMASGTEVLPAETDGFLAELGLPPGEILDAYTAAVAECDAPQANHQLLHWTMRLMLDEARDDHLARMLEALDKQHES